MGTTFRTICTEKKLLVPRIWELRFQKPAGFTFTAGQFVLFSVPLRTNPADVQPRAYSIASAPGEDELLFVIKTVPGGRASEWVEEILAPGAEVTMQGPFGMLRLVEDFSHPFLFVATGTGVAPFRSQILWALHEKSSMCRMNLLFGVRAPEELFWGEEWQALEREFPHFRIHCSFLNGAPDWHGATGDIAARLPQLLTAPQSTHVYLCGAPDMVKVAREQCLSLGVPPAHLHMESYV